MPDKNYHKPGNWREVALLLTALLPVAIASYIVSLIPSVTVFPGWLNEIVDSACWAPMCFVFVFGWARLLYLFGLLGEEQLSRYPFGLSSGRN